MPDGGQLFDPGAGLGALQRANVIALQQTCDTYAQLHAITGVVGMQVYARGAFSINDGGQGNYFWSITSNAPNSPPAVIAPSSGAPTGRWLLCSTANGIGFSNVRAVTNAGVALVLATDQIVSLQIAGASATISLPTPALSQGRVLTFKDGLGNAGLWPTTFNVAGGALIDGNAQAYISAPYQVMSFFSDGTQWSIF